MVSIIISAIPGLRKIPKRIPKFVFNARIRAIIFTGQFFFIGVPPLVVLSLSEALFIEGELSVSHQLYQAGMAYLAFNYIVYTAVFAVFFTIFREAARKRIQNLEGSTDVEGKRDSTLLVMTIQKVKKPLQANTTNKQLKQWLLESSV